MVQRQTFGQLVRKSVSDSIHRTGTDAIWHHLMPPVYRMVLSRNKQVKER